MRISADTGFAARPGEPNAMFETFMAGICPLKHLRTARCLWTLIQMKWTAALTHCSVTRSLLYEIELR